MLTLYVMSLRRRELPEAFSTMDRIRAERVGEREFLVDGAALWNTFCVACHGPNGEGMRYAGMPPFPAVGNPDFLAIAPEALVRATVERGRPGRRMPSWTAAGLRPTEIDAVVAHVRTLGGGITPRPDPKPPRWVRGDVRAGESLFQANCSGCHGRTGAGGEGPALVNAVLLGAATDTYLVETIRTGRRGTAMEGFATPSPTRPALSDPEIESIVAFLRSKLEGS
jgi:cbb3-type cytochrome c oxidase subunit III